MAGWTIPMGSQVSVDDALRRHREARAAVKGCYCPDDCRCRREDNPPCGCRQHPHPSRVTPTGPGHVTGVQPPTGPVCEWRLPESACCGDPGDCTERCA